MAAEEPPTHPTLPPQTSALPAGSTAATAPDPTPTSMPTSMPTSIVALIDTNVVLDLLLQRDPWFTQALPLWEARDHGRIFLQLLASVLTDIYYITRKQVGAERARHLVGSCLTGFTILALDHSLLEEALRLPGTDFEDNVQIAAAQRAQSDVLVTRNPRDYTQAQLPVMEPLTFIEQFLS